MAKQVGTIKIEGTLDNLSFYSSVFGDIVRRKGGASKEKIRKSPKFARLREHQEEFTNCVAAAKLLRNKLSLFSGNAPDHKLVGRVNKLMHELKNLDRHSIRGKRHVSAGLRTDEGKLLLQGFEFNSSVALDKLLKKELIVEKGQIAFKDLIPKRHIKAPKMATHVRITGIVSKIDFELKVHVMNSEEVELKLDTKKHSFVLKPKASKQKGNLFYFLMINFLYEGKVETKELKRSNGFTLLTVEEAPKN